MPTIDLTTYEPVPGTVGDANAIKNAFIALQTLLNGQLDATNFAAGTFAAIPAGSLVDFAGSSAPTGWLICDGSAISRSSYAGLYAAIGTSFGAGDGTTTFNLPDTRGRATVGYTASGGHTDVSTIGNNDGVPVANRRPKHNSTVTDPGHAHATQGYLKSGIDDHTLGGNAGGSSQSAGSGTSSATTGITVGPGGTAPIDTPAYLVVNKIVKT